MYPISIVVPAHNEVATIGRFLTILLGDDAEDLEVIVVCNGCTDGTAEVVRASFPDVRVIEMEKPSKAAALNAGDAAARWFPRFYADADVELTKDVLVSAADLLRGGSVLAVSPRARFDLSECSSGVRRFHDVWEQLPYRKAEMSAAGVYGLSEAGRARFKSFPSLISDDQYIMQLFPDGERRTGGSGSVLVHPPRNLRSLVRVRTRVYRGKRELAASGLARTPPTPASGVALLKLLVHPHSCYSAMVYTGVNLAAKLRSRGHARSSWERDETTRNST